MDFDETCWYHSRYYDLETGFSIMSISSRVPYINLKKIPLYDCVSGIMFAAISKLHGCSWGRKLVGNNYI